MVEQGTENPRVVGSIPTGGTTYADLAHLVERRLAKAKVAGSSPVIRSIKNNTKANALVLFFMQSNLRGSNPATRRVRPLLSLRCRKTYEKMELWRKQGFEPAKRQRGAQHPFAFSQINNEKTATRRSRPLLSLRCRRIYGTMLFRRKQRFEPTVNKVPRQRLGADY